jgi:hypothetical protein
MMHNEVEWLIYCRPEVLADIRQLAHGMTSC